MKQINGTLLIKENKMKYCIIFIVLVIFLVFMSGCSPVQKSNQSVLRALHILPQDSMVEGKAHNNGTVSWIKFLCLIGLGLSIWAFFNGNSHAINSGITCGIMFVLCTVIQRYEVFISLAGLALGGWVAYKSLFKTKGFLTVRKEK